jgi:hypothetical protein
MGLCLRRLVLQYSWRGGRFQPESMAAFNRNQGQSPTGIGGRFRPESVAIFARNTQSATVQLLKRHKIPFLFILNQIKPNTNITAQAVAALSHHGPVAETFIADRVPYAAAMTDGRTAIELDPKGRAATETAALWKNIKVWLPPPATSSKKEKAHA